MKTLSLHRKKKGISILIIMAVLWNAQLLFAQSSGNRLSRMIAEKKTDHDFKPVSIFRNAEVRAVDNFVRKGTVFEINSGGLRQIIQQESPGYLFTIPSADGANIQLELVKVDYQKFDVVLKGRLPQRKFNYKSGVHFRGIIKGDPNSFAAISFFEDNIMGVFSNSNGNYELVKIKNEHKYIMYNIADLMHPAQMKCGTKDQFGVSAPPGNYKNGNPNVLESTDPECRIVNCFYEADYQMYQDFDDSTELVVNFITGAFNQVATLYYNEDVLCEISEIVVWDTTDYLSAFSAWDISTNPLDIFFVLPVFIQEWGSNFNGDVAQFLTSRSDIHPSPPSALAQKINGLCNKFLCHSAVNFDTLIYSNYPSYSVNIAIMTHEMGHILGSPHTNACFWNGNNTALDACATIEPYNGSGCSLGTPPPHDSTIMSYCFPYNFSYGFGPQPGGVCYSNVQHAQCLKGTRNKIVHGLSVTSINRTTATVKWNDIPAPGPPTLNDYTVEYKLSVDTVTPGILICNKKTWNVWTTTSDTTYNVTGLIPGASYDWRVTYKCSPPSLPASFTTLKNSGCSTPSRFGATALEYNTAFLWWEAFASATYYVIKFKQVDSTAWQSDTVYKNSAFVCFGTGRFEWQVKADCGSWSSSQVINITGHDLSYCMLKGDSAQAASMYINKIEIEELENTSGNNHGYYLNDVDTALYRTLGDTLHFTFIIHNATGERASVVVFFDTNQDTDFDDEGEDVSRFYTFEDTITSYFRVPTNSLYDRNRIRIIAMRGIPPPPFAPSLSYLNSQFCGTFSYGEVEDYQIKIVPVSCTVGPYRLAQNLAQADITLSPNPVRDMLNVRIKNANKKYTLTIYSLTGNILKQQYTWADKTAIDVSSLSKGVYFVSVVSEDKKAVNMKFIKL